MEDRIDLRESFLCAVLKVHEKTLAIYDTMEYNIVSVSLDFRIQKNGL